MGTPKYMILLGGIGRCNDSTNDDTELKRNFVHLTSAHSKNRIKEDGFPLISVRIIFEHFEQNPHCNGGHLG